MNLKAQKGGMLIWRQREDIPACSSFSKIVQCGEDAKTESTQTVLTYTDSIVAYLPAAYYLI